MTSQKIGTLSRVKNTFEQTYILLMLILIISVVATIVNRRFIHPQNIINIFQQIAVLGVVASGVGMLLVSGHVDISVGSQVSLLGVIFAMLIQKILNLPEGNVESWRRTMVYPISIAITFGVGTLVGFVNGLTVVKSRANSFIISLGFMSAYHGLALLVTGGASYMLFGRFEVLGRGRIFHYLPISILFFLGVVICSHLILKYFRYGRFLYAIGSNRKAAHVSGINTDWVIIKAYTVVGILNALAAIILISRVGSALATTGDSYALDALASVIVGGVALSGGKGGAINIFLGVVLIGLIGNALIIMNVNPYARDLVIGLIIIAAVALSRFSER
ncbi:MAG: ribose transport system permease protein [Candidatus Atribacteria bacterium]|jgi:ribose transport system permease protein|nr:ribose transport system permease protein [Candidatus Atribacteria bacterium]